MKILGKIIATLCMPISLLEGMFFSASSQEPYVFFFFLGASLAFWLLPRAFAVYCLLLSAVAGMNQFDFNHFLPLILSMVVLTPLYWLRRRWLPWALLIPVNFGIIFLLDAGFLHHRIAVEFRRVAIPGFSHYVDSIHLSPSGQTCVYSTINGWTGGGNTLWISTKGNLYPMIAYVDDPGNERSLRDENFKWHREIFTAEDKLIIMVYDERDGMFYKRSDFHDHEWNPKAQHEVPARFHEFIIEKFSDQLSEKQDDPISQP